MDSSIRIDMTGTGQKIDTLRKDAGLTVRDIQSCLGLASAQTVYKWLSGKSLPSIDNLVILSAILHVSLDDLIVRC